MAKHIPWTAHVLWHDDSSGEVEFETTQGMRRWMTDLDWDHTRQVTIQHNPMRVGVTYDVEVHHD